MAITRTMDSPQTMTDDQNKFNKDLANLINSAAAMASAARKSPSSVPTTPSPSKDPRLRKRAAPQQSAVKKIKLEHSSDAQDGTNVHPSRLPLVDGHTEPPMSTRSSPAPLTQFSELQLHHQMQLLQRTGSNRVPLGNSKRRTNKSLDAYTLSRHDSAVSKESAALVSNIPRAINEDIAPPNTLRDAVWRQWDSSKDGLPYEQLLEKRRTEQLGSKVDRYVPSLEVPKDRRIAYRLKSSSFPFAKLPEKVRAKILSLLLVKNDCIIIDFVSLTAAHCSRFLLVVCSTTASSEACEGLLIYSQGASAPVMRARSGMLTNILDRRGFAPLSMVIAGFPSLRRPSRTGRCLRTPSP